MTDSKLVDVNAVIESQKLGTYQIGLAALLLVCMFVDGFEAQAPGFAAPFIIRDLSIPRSACCASAPASASAACFRRSSRWARNFRRDALRRRRSGCC